MREIFFKICYYKLRIDFLIYIFLEKKKLGWKLIKGYVI